MRCQAGNSASRAALPASSVSCRAKVRSEVPTGSSAAPSYACRRSSVRMCQDTPSTTRWCATSSSRPCRSAPPSKKTASSTRPASGSSRATACSAARRIASGSTPSTVVRVTAPVAVTSCDHSIGFGRLSRRRSASCRATRASSAACSRAAVAPGGVRSRSAWCRRLMPPPSSASRCTIGSSATSPTPSLGAATGAGAASAWASAAGVRLTKTSRGEIRTPLRLARLTSWMATMLSPPRAKKSPSAGTGPARAPRRRARACW